MESLDSTLNLMADKILDYDEISFLELVQFVWRRGWKLESASEPMDPDKLRRAIKACLIERMVEIWNSPPKNSDEHCPRWCDRIPAVEERFSVIKPDEQSFWQEELSNPIFEKRNIFAPKEFMFFL